MSPFSPVKSAERTVALLETLAASPHRMRVGEIRRVTGHPRSSLHALPRTLRGLRSVEADESGSSFDIGPSALLTGTAHLDRYEALPAAARTLEELRDRLGCTVHFARRVVCVAATVSYRIPATDAISCSLPAAAATVPGVPDAGVAATTDLVTILRREGVR